MTASRRKFTRESEARRREDEDVDKVHAEQRAGQKEGAQHVLCP